MKRMFLLVFCLTSASGAIGAEQTDPCVGSEGSELIQCRSNQQALRQQQLETMVQQQQERQNQLDAQQREIQQQLETLRRENESLHKQVQRDTTMQAARPVATDFSANSDLKSWRAENPWFGTNYPKTQFAMRYLKQLQHDQPDLSGRELLDALSRKVTVTFGAKP